MGFLGALFFLYFVRYAIVGESSMVEEKINLISFFSANPERRMEAGAITISLVFLGVILSSWIIARDNIKRKIERIRTIEEIDKIRTEFIWVASHQIRTPLSALKWSIKMILEGDYGKLNKEQRDILIEAYNINEELIVLTTELLNVAQIETKRLAVNLKSLSLGEFQKAIEQTSGELKILADKKNLRLTFKFSLLSLPDARVKVDISKILQVVRNLIENAIRYTHSNGDIKVKIAIVKNEVVAQIIDKGIGIPEKEQSKVFSKFFRASNALKAQSDGTGLGLYLCKIFIEKHGGKIWFVSQEGKGSAFSFSLPLEIETPQEEFLRRL